MGMPFGLDYCLVLEPDLGLDFGSGLGFESGFLVSQVPEDMGKVLIQNQ